MVFKKLTSLLHKKWWILPSITTTIAISLATHNYFLQKQISRLDDQVTKWEYSGNLAQKTIQEFNLVNNNLAKGNNTLKNQVDSLENQLEKIDSEFYNFKRDFVFNERKQYEQQLNKQKQLFDSLYEKHFIAKIRNEVLEKESKQLKGKTSFYKEQIREFRESYSKDYTAPPFDKIPLSFTCDKEILPNINNIEKIQTIIYFAQYTEILTQLPQSRNENTKQFTIEHFSKDSTQYYMIIHAEKNSSYTHLTVNSKEANNIFYDANVDGNPNELTWEQKNHQGKIVRRVNLDANSTEFYYPLYSNMAAEKFNKHLDNFYNELIADYNKDL